MIRNKTFELQFNGKEPAGSLINSDLTAEFFIGADRKTVKGFYAGNGVYKIRFLPEKAGQYTWKVKGLFNAQGQENCEESDFRGITRAVETHFESANGKTFAPFGTTVYALVHQREDLVDETIESLKNSPFNKVRMCVFPKHYDYNHNEPPLFAYEFKDGKPDTSKPVFAFWDMLERRLTQMNDSGIESDLIIFHPYDKWGFSKLTKEQCFEYLEYLTRRLSAFPNIWWSLANEYELVISYTGLFPEFAKYIFQNDPYKHLLSNHQIFSPYDFSPSEISHVCLQTSDITHTAKWIKRYNKPVVYDEIKYEGNIAHDWGNISGRELTDRFWRIYASGAYATHGETFITKENSDDEILWWGKGGKLRGESVPRIKFLKELIDSLALPLKPVTSGIAIAALMEYETLQKTVAEVEKSGSGNTFIALFKNLTQEGYEQISRMSEKSFSQAGDNAFLYYLAESCPIIFEVDLPQTGKYSIFVIDTWNMKKTKFASNVNGKVKVDLPGKEAFAVLAVKE